MTKIKQTYLGSYLESRFEVLTIWASILQSQEQTWGIQQLLHICSIL